MISETTIMWVLRENAYRTPDGGWWFTNPDNVHSEADARAIVEACLILGQPVTDVATSQGWLALIRRVAALEDQVKEIRS